MKLSLHTVAVSVSMAHLNFLLLEYVFASSAAVVLKHGSVY